MMLIKKGFLKKSRIEIYFFITMSRVGDIAVIKEIKIPALVELTL